MLSELDQFYSRYEEPNKSCLLTLRDIIVSLDPGVGQAWKYRLPMFTFNKKNFCYLWMDKVTKHPYIGVMEGRNIEHPLLIQGDRKRIKVLNIHPEKDIPIEVIQEILHEALDLYR